MLKFITSLPQQLEETSKVRPPKIKGGPFKKVLFAGMGGSAISGDLVRSFLWEEPYQIDVVRDYSLPGYVNKDFLFVVTSYSGNTEETLSVLNYGLERGLTTVAITSDGKLKEIAMDKGLPLLTVPEGYPPRGALGYLLGNSLKMLAGAGMLDDGKVTEELKRNC